MDGSTDAGLGVHDEAGVDMTCPRPTRIRGQERFAAGLM